MTNKPHPNSSPGQSRILFLGVFPPPIHGASMVNQRLEEEFNAAGNEVKRLDLVGSRWAGLRSRPLFLLLKTANVGLLWLRFLWLVLRPGRRVLYVSTAGGYGKVFELPFLLVARSLRLRIWYHHHSFQYLGQRLYLTRTSFLFAGRNAHHVTLCAHMRAKLCDLYGINPKRIRVLSNSGLLQLSAPHPPAIRERLHTLGFLSNISFAKGIRSFVELCEVLQREGANYHARIAGPCISAEVEAYVNAATQRIPNLQYLGPCYRDDKISFLDSIDILVFPSLYKNEAEPLVIHEANSRGVYVLTIGGGCIGEVLQSAGGEVLDGSKFVEHAASRIADLQRHPDLIDERSRASISIMVQRRSSSQQALQDLLNAFTFRPNTQ